MMRSLKFIPRSRFWKLGCLWLLAASGWSALATTITVDPVTPALTNSTGLGEWNTDGDFESWTTTSVTSASVAGGTLSGTGSADTAQISKLSFAGGPDLDLGFNDFLDLRIQVSASFTGAVSIYYGSTNTTGINALRVVNIPNDSIVKDGAPHLYRVEMGLEAPWRGNLTDLRLELSSALGVAFAIDYLRVGDIAGDVYSTRISANCPATGGIGPNGSAVSSMESKHFRFIWDNWSVTNFPSFWKATMPHGTLRNLEEVWQVHIKKLQYREPAESWTVANRDGKKYKVNVTAYFGGYWAGGDAGDYAWLNITPDGLRVDPPTWVPPHEFMHVCQMHQRDNGSTVDGPWWESHANFAREQWIYHYASAFDLGGGSLPSNLDSFFTTLAHLYHSHGRAYYLCWPLFMYLDENPDNLPDLGFGFTANIWKQTTPNEFLYDTISRLSPNNSRKDILGYMARRNATWNYSHKANLQAAAAAGDSEFLTRYVFPDLQVRPDDINWFRVPIERAPMQGAYAIHQLIPIGSGAGRVVTVNFHGLSNAARGADWRASLVIVNDSGAERYVPAGTGWSNGVQSATLAANENKVLLAVAATPDSFPAGGQDDSIYPYQSHPQRVRFPYEIQVTGATPKDVGGVSSTSGLVQHANGGGWRAPTATVDATAYIGPNARVLNTAKVRNNARIEDYAVVEGSAIVSNNAVVSGHALVRNTAVVKDNAKVRDYAMIIDSSVIAGNARILEHARMVAGAQARDWATVKGCVEMWRDAGVDPNQYVGGDGVCDGDFSAARTVTNGFQFGFLPYNPGPMEWITNRTAPRRLFAAYDFATAHDSLAKDSPGVTDGYLLGNPSWYNSDGQRAGFLACNGINQGVLLDRSVSDLPEMSVTAWVKWSGGVGKQPVFYFGSATNKCMYFTPDNGSGQAEFSIVNGGAAQTLTWASAFPIGVWTHVAVTLSNSVSGRLYINGTNVATGGITIKPDQLNAPNVNTAAQQNYLARGIGNGLPFFRGALDGVRVYTGPLTDLEISAMQPQSAIAGTGTLYVDLRATNAAASSLGTFNTWTNLGSLVGNFTKISTPTYATNVAGTGIPGVQFNGSTAAYQGPNSIADIDGASDRTIEVWAYNPSLVEEETMVSWGHRWSTRQDLAFNFGNNATWGAATHWGDDVGWGTAPTANAWHHLVYTYANSTVRVYVDGALRNTRTLGGALNTYPNEPINLGCQREAANGTRSLFYSGYINSVRIWGGEMTANQVAADFQFGPWTLASSAKAIVFAPVSNVAVNAGATLSVTNSAIDPNQPPLPLTFSVLSAPDGAAIDAGSGLFTWRPAVAQANTTNLITLKVENNANPSLSATQSFVATINAVSTPTLSNVSAPGGAFGFRISGSLGPDCLIQSSTNLVNWSTIYSTNPVSMPFDWTDTNSMLEPARFYRVLLGP